MDLHRRTKSLSLSPPIIDFKNTNAVTQFSKIYPARFDAFQAELDDTYSDLNLHSGVYSRRAEGLDDLLSRLGKTELSKLISMNTNGADEIPKCTICWAEYLHADRITTLPCHEKHHFHESCIEVSPSFETRKYHPI
ncbi:hypothetical protein PSHT_15077 [Puccinia striiformis]|uniref:RING-type domain-containing protein n=1 Tax=Puccinia striiformis TaxID=27350 RepID=A0A2S4UGY1_9BASI|nr:hypothetical protein PSHT_15077 [Puccinia striiformis]